MVVWYLINIIFSFFGTATDVVVLFIIVPTSKPPSPPATLITDTLSLRLNYAIYINIILSEDWA
ncbi:hypothetical protein CWC46_08240 [Prodigiosinella confusarubida]|uniref:Uncharacterized protein n=1 Tax=Serratia sp. (strain ATCC 39006) TaxID=104623 RepID=A0A2I5THT9_SERS3|nr:hypothetical protein CWC46_08240 [Serratia sp. ATCC 39006]AUH04130.1 hypothetical protein Ser39006_008245 [Serratia sp. ATCC 39006]